MAVSICFVQGNFDYEKYIKVYGLKDALLTGNMKTVV